MDKLIALVMFAVLSGCAVPQGGMKRGGMTWGAPAQQYSVEEAVEVVTEPPGARIQINNVFVGNSPVKASAHRVWRGDPGQMVLDPVRIEAYPAGPGQCVQSGVFGEGSRKVASPVLFNMTDCAAAQQSRRKK